MKALSIFILNLICVSSFAQQFVANYDESKIPPYTLPALLVANDGAAVTTSGEWAQKRRMEVFEIFESQVYGKVPSGNVSVETTLVSETSALGGKARMKQIRLSFSNEKGRISLDLLIIVPAIAGKKPLFVGLNFNGNHTIIDDPNVTIPESWVENNEKLITTGNKATSASRGMNASRWPAEMIIDRGYGIATAYYGAIDPDKDDLSDGIHALFYKKDQKQPASDEWGSIAAWAWGLSRVMDYLETDSDVDASKVALMGHSRLGKTALWAGAADQRFAIVISNNSGCGGAALSKRQIGETVGVINSVFPHWFCDNFNQYNENEASLPVDQHMLLALIAPRPLYVASAQDDHWADPKGEFLSAYYAGVVYQLFGLEGLPTDVIPEMNSPILKSIGYHIRTGGHDVTDFDWKAWIDFADVHFKK